MLPNGKNKHFLHGLFIYFRTGFDKTYNIFFIIFFKLKHG